MAQGIETYSLKGITALCEQLGLPRFRSKQLIGWLYGRGVESYDEMGNLPRAMRNALANEAPFVFPQVSDKQVSADGTRKYVLTLADGARVETVGIPSHERDANGLPKRLTTCVSSQVGCAMGCAFCATGTEGFTRNLFPGEIAQQVLVVARDFGQRVSNVVVMGQGEPFLNYDNTLDALRILNAPDALGIGARHIVVSTCGVLPGIARFADEPEQFTLAVSLHSAVQSARDALMPQCANMPLDQLKRTIFEYYEHCGRRVSLEYLLIRGVNDAEDDLQALVTFARGLHVYVNLLSLNEVDGSPWKPVGKATQQQWITGLETAGIECAVRNSRGSDIDGACGQLKNKMHS